MINIHALQVTQSALVLAEPWLLRITVFAIVKGSSPACFGHLNREPLWASSHFAQPKMINEGNKVLA